jgi:Mn2+/Fe2+ NRAMP family transporter
MFATLAHGLHCQKPILTSFRRPEFLMRFALLMLASILALGSTPLHADVNVRHHAPVRPFGTTAMGIVTGQISGSNEPLSFALFGVGLLGAAGVVRRFAR